MYVRTSFFGTLQAIQGQNCTDCRIDVCRNCSEMLPSLDNKVSK